MRTDIDEVSSDWYLDGLAVHEDKLMLVLALSADIPDAPPPMLEDAIDPEEQQAALSSMSLRYGLMFENWFSHAVVDQQYAPGPVSLDPADDGPNVFVVTKSGYLDFMMQQSPQLFDATVGARHYRVLTRNAIVDVISNKDPVTQLLSS